MSMQTLGQMFEERKSLLAEHKRLRESVVTFCRENGLVLAKDYWYLANEMDGRTCKAIVNGNVCGKVVGGSPAAKPKMCFAHFKQSKSRGDVVLSAE